MEAMGIEPQQAMDAEVGPNDVEWVYEVPRAPCVPERPLKARIAPKHQISRRLCRRCAG